MSSVTEHRKKESFSRNLIIVICVSIVAILIGVGIGVYVYMRRRKASSGSESSGEKSFAISDLTNASYQMRMNTCLCRTVPVTQISEGARSTITIQPAVCSTSYNSVTTKMFNVTAFSSLNYLTKYEVYRKSWGTKTYLMAYDSSTPFTDVQNQDMVLKANSVIIPTGFDLTGNTLYGIDFDTFKTNSAMQSAYDAGLMIGLLYSVNAITGSSENNSTMIIVHSEAASSFANTVNSNTGNIELLYSVSSETLLRTTTRTPGIALMSDLKTPATKNDFIYGVIIFVPI